MFAQVFFRCLRKKEVLLFLKIATKVYVKLLSTYFLLRWKYLTRKIWFLIETVQSFCQGFRLVTSCPVGTVSFLRNIKNLTILAFILVFKIVTQNVKNSMKKLSSSISLTYIFRQSLQRVIIFCGHKYSFGALLVLVRILQNQVVKFKAKLKKFWS